MTEWITRNVETLGLPGIVLLTFLENVFPEHNRLYFAFRELGRAVRTAFLLH